MDDQPEPAHNPDQIIVDLHHLQVVGSELERLALGFDVAEEHQGLGLALLTNVQAGGQEVDVDEVIAMLRSRFAADRDGWVPLLGKNRRIDSSSKPLGHKPMLFGHKPMGFPQVAATDQLPPVATTAGAGVRIGVVDTPLIDSDALLADTGSLYTGHSRFVTSVIEQRAGAATVVVRGAIDAAAGRADSWDVATAMVDLVAEDQVDILNLSLGCYAAGGPPFVISRAIDRLSSQVLMVAAAGNHGQFTTWVNGRTNRSATWPAAVQPVIAVGSYGGTAESAFTPAWSPDRPWVVCSAPGVDVVGRYVTGTIEFPDGNTETFTGCASWSGTSMSTAAVTGEVAARMAAGHGITARAAFDQLMAENTVVKPFPLAP